MTRARTLVISTAILATAGMVMAPAAYASITNPANNPHRIVVQGDDGNTYVDGQDTLPGYDDIECTFIPGAWFDFDNNRVYYADGQSIPWTEWDRIAGYDKWLKAKQASQQSSTSSSSTSSSSSSSSTKSSSGSTDETSVTEVAAAEDPVASPSASASPEPSPSAEPSVEPSPSAEPVDDVSAAGPADVADASGAGRIVLIGLFVLGVITFLAYEIVRRRGGRTVA